MVMDADGGRPARNLYVRGITLVLLLLLLMGTPFVLGAWYAPFHRIQDIIPENLNLKRQNSELSRQLADIDTMNSLKDEQIESLQQQIDKRDSEIRDLSQQVRMFNSILDERKGKGIQVMSHQAKMLNLNSIEWQALFVKGGTYPRYLVGSYKIFALDDSGKHIELLDKAMKYRFETHVMVKQKIEWKEDWIPTKLELIIYNNRKKEVLKQVIQVQGT